MNVYPFCLCPFPFGFESGMWWDLIVLILDHCLSVYFAGYGSKLFLKFGEELY